ncbi:TM1266 family iron-only hydrogenase system putative regulator [Maridesulfovibrio bastinii]|jgi:putative iron-only hydrogenase system regulator|uniref:TM1266 family iron-only hydrogenase system putative regulator n=1 Tax=Maridesulfovibrio bastinii TaxID=47157 RepID=UPI0003FA1C0A|nr:TM1266 family iron-only hydrogenase system putative regulator [Maridesulfovibrio bastinii]
MEKRIGIVGVIIHERVQAAPKVNEMLGKFGELIVGRIGLPYKDKGINVIGLIVEATTDELGALTGKLGMIKGVRVKSLMV